MLQAVLLDIDGTLVDTVDLHAEAWRQAFAHFGYHFSYISIRQQIGKGGDQLMPVFLSSEELKKVKEDLESYRAQLYQSQFLPKARAFPGTRAFVERLRQDGLSVALASSAKKTELSTYKRLADIEDLVDEETSADEVRHSKPEPDVFTAVLARLNLKPDNAIAIGDSPYDAQAAQKIGMPSIGLLCGGFPADWLKSAGAIAIYASIEDLLQNYDRSPLVGYAA